MRIIRNHITVLCYGFAVACTNSTGFRFLCLILYATLCPPTVVRDAASSAIVVTGIESANEDATTILSAF